MQLEIRRRCRAARNQSQPESMTTLEILFALGLTLVSLAVVPTAIFVVRSLQAIDVRIGQIHHDVKWLRKEHEAESGVQQWKNPGLVQAVEKLDESLDRFVDKIESIFADIRQHLHDLGER